MSIIQVEATLDECLNYGRIYEHFIDLIADQVRGNLALTDKPLDDDDDVVLIRGYDATSITTPNVIEFTVQYDVERA